MSRRLFSMSGNFDDPPSHPASESPIETAERLVQDILERGPNSNTTISPSGELYRAISRYTEARRAGAQAQLLNNSETRNMSSSERRIETLRRAERQRRIEGRRPQRQTTMPTAPGELDENQWENLRRAEIRRRDLARPPPQPTISRRRPRLLQSDRYMEPQRALNEGSSLSSVPEDLRQLEIASLNLRTLLETPIGSRLSSPDYVAEGENNRRVKRRKLDQDDKEESWQGFKYGRYGQVEPGTLQMEIVSCDGGLFQSFPEGEYGSDNVLKDDNTVYCTKSNRCNIVLKHQGETTFSLTELVIKAPHKGYTAPVQEGMVFISGTSNDLLTRTAQYQIQYSSPTGSSERPPIMSIRHNDDGTRTMTTAQARAGRLVALGAQDPECDLTTPYIAPTAQIPSDFTNITSPYQVTMECSSDFSDNEDQPRNNRAHRMRLRDMPDDDLHLIGESSEEDDFPTGYRLSDDGNHYYHDASLLGRLRRRETASNITLAEAAEASQIATQEAVAAVGGELMVPHAKFFIERDKSKCTIKFSTPISGKYILLKLWSPDGRSDGNIDIQSVVAKGFAGPRFFPKVDLM
ncbi:aefc5370-d2b2-4b30-a28e-85fc374f8741 [Sclerotinia trifoliorum]|uniref:Aefc5370-d2b2-4b30-a28e-85fc374f8741 n=1 Tax=Sclerotinia trifoliorum TaxID=28548 RepID=A0A8H2ZV92_9HELO|nr:aefc5370-d2b2-4b30-a28e-85fc374f8741 [Sclerotinia trifoliorum]